MTISINSVSLPMIRPPYLHSLAGFYPIRRKEFANIVNAAADSPWPVIREAQVPEVFLTFRKDADGGFDFQKQGASALVHDDKIGDAGHAAHPFDLGSLSLCAKTAHGHMETKAPGRHGPYVLNDTGL
jgi:hypothetical protein